LKNYVLTEQAQEDINEILSYVLDHENQSGALTVLDYLHAAMEDVGNNPKLGNYRNDLTDRPVKFYRKHRSHIYYILFNPLIKPVPIIRIASTRRDFTRLLAEGK
jgi:plasmid stabilization system protein ParE